MCLLWLCAWFCVCVRSGSKGGKWLYLVGIFLSLVDFPEVICPGDTYTHIGALILI